VQINGHEIFGGSYAGDQLEPNSFKHELTQRRLLTSDLALFEKNFQISWGLGISMLPTPQFCLPNMRECFSFQAYQLNEPNKSNNPNDSNDSNHFNKF